VRQQFAVLRADQLCEQQLQPSWPIVDVPILVYYGRGATAEGGGGGRVDARLLSKWQHLTAAKEFDVKLQEGGAWFLLEGGEGGEGGEAGRWAGGVAGGASPRAAFAAALRADVLDR
jgi:hypothetical protein